MATSTRILEDTGSHTKIEAFYGDVLVGFVQLTANGDGTQTLEICYIDGTFTEGDVNPPTRTAMRPTRTAMRPPRSSPTPNGQGEAAWSATWVPIRKPRLQWFAQSTNAPIESDWAPPPTA